MGIPRGSQRDPKPLLRQSAALLGDQLFNPMYKVATQALNITVRVDVLRDFLQPRCMLCIPGDPVAELGPYIILIRIIV